MGRDGTLGVLAQGLVRWMAVVKVNASANVVTVKIVGLVRGVCNITMGP